MHWIVSRVGYVLMAFVLLATTATAGMLPTDPLAYNDGINPIWHGTKAFIQTGASASTAMVDYAVYAPHKFSLSAALNFPVDPTGGSNDYIYAFEIYNNTGAGATQKVFNLSVGVDYDGFNMHALPIGLSWVGHLASPDTPFVSGPNLSQIIRDTTPLGVANGSPAHSVKWSYGNQFVAAASSHSDILYFASPYAPKMILSSMTFGVGAGGSEMLPSPTPEPATGVLAGIAVLCLLAVKWTRRRPA